MAREPGITKKVILNELVFSQSWEDPILDYMSINIKPGYKIMCITSGGCNALNFLKYDPSKVYSIDLNPCQSFLLELKITAIRLLNHIEFCSFWGISESVDRVNLYKRMRDELGKPAREFWDGNINIIAKGLLLAGKFEQFIIKASRVLRFIIGNRRIGDLFECEDLISQRKYFEKRLDNRRLRLIFNIVFNKWTYPTNALKSDYFEYFDGATTFADSYYRQFRKALYDIPAKSNYFLSMYLRNAYHDLYNVPDFINPLHYDTIRSRVDRIRILTSDATGWLKSMEDNSLDGFSLSNICELCSTEETNNLFDEIARTGKNNAGICFRNLVVSRSVPDYKKDIIITDEELSNELVHSDRSFIYSKVYAYKIHK